MNVRWIFAGQEISSSQWNDVIGIMGIASHTLDLAYLHAWSEKLGVADLLQRALDEVK